MSSVLPEFIDIPRLVKHRGHFQGSYSLAQLTRVHDRLHTIEGKVDFSLDFQHDEQWRMCVIGQLSSTVIMECQRCLQAVRVEIQQPIALIALAEGQSDENLPEGYEPLWLEDSPLKLQELIEDELILAMPMIARHDPCPDLAEEVISVLVTETDAGVEDSALLPIEEASTRPANPFAVLASLKKSQ